MRAQADAEKREAIETGRRKVAEVNAKTEAMIKALEEEKARLQQQREREAARAHEEAEKRVAKATAAAMEEAKRKIQRETPPGGSRVEKGPRFFDGDPAYRIEIDLDAGDSGSSKGKEKTPKMERRRAGRHPRDFNPYITCSDGDGRDHRHYQEPTGCKVGVPEASGRESDDTPPISGAEGPAPPYRSRESSPCRPPPRFGP